MPSLDDASTSSLQVDDAIGRLAERPPDLLDELLDQSTLSALFGGPKKTVQVGRYEVSALIGHGATSVVYDGHDPKLERDVAIKALTISDALGDEELRRIQAEAQTLARLSHPNVVSVYDVVSTRDTIFIVMEKIEGDELTQWLEVCGRTWSEVIDMFVQVGQGLVAAHELGIVHRDVKPANIRVGADGRPKLVDFGLAKALASLSDLTSRDDADGGDAPLASAAVGTPAYAAPEQAAAAVVSPAADQYSFCVALHEALHGSFPAVSPARHSSAAGVDPVPRWIGPIIARGLSEEPSARFASMRSLVEALDPARRRRPWVWSAGVLIAGLAVASATYAGSAPVQPPDACQAPVGMGSTFWTEARRGAVEAALLGTERAHATQTWGRVDESIGAYVDEWDQAYLATCDPGMSAAEAETQRACLVQSHAALEQLVDVLGRADPTIADLAVQTTRKLPAASDCSERTAQQSGPTPESLPDSLQARVADVREQMARVAVLRDTGQLDEALPLMREVLDDARDIEFGPLLAQAELSMGLVLRRSGDNEKAAQLLRSSYFTATESGELRAAGSAAGLLATLYHHHLSGKDDPSTWIRHAEAAFERVGENSSRRAILLGQQAELYRDEGDTQRALDTIQRAIVMLEADDADALELSTNLGRLSSIQLARDETEAAIETARRALELATRVLGPEHPTTARHHITLGEALVKRGLFDDAETEARQGLALFEGGGIEPRSAAKAHDILSRIYSERGDHEAAYKEAQATDELFLRFYGADYLPRVHPLRDMANARKLQGNVDESFELLGKALALQQRAGARDVELGDTHAELAETFLFNYQYDEALVHIITAIELISGVYGSDHDSMAPLLTTRGRILMYRGGLEPPAGDVRRAIGDLRRADEIVQASIGPSHPDRAKVLINLARAEQRLGNLAEGSDTMEMACRILVDNGASPLWIGWTKYDLARMLWRQPSERARALVVAQESVDALTLAGEDSVDRRDHVAKWLREHRQVKAR